MSRPFLFFKELLRAPSRIGAVCPSSEHVAHVVCDMLPRHRKGLIVEVGPGTGALTAALVQRIQEKDRLMLLEHSPYFASALRDSYPQVAVIHGDAAKMDQFIAPDTEVAAIVSSLPLLNFAPEYRAQILRQYHDALPKRGRLIFVSYNMRCNQEILKAGFTSRYHRFEMRNLPPARVDCFLSA